MLKQNWRLISRLERLGDFALVLAAFFLAYYGRSGLGYLNQQLELDLPFSGTELAPLKDYVLVLVIALLGYGVSLNVLGAYNSMRLTTGWRLLRTSVFSSVLVFLVLGAALFVLKVDLSRSFVGLFCLLACFGLVLERIGVLALLRFWRRRGRNFRNIIICGLGPQAIQVAQRIAQLPELGIRIRGFAQLKEQGTFDDRVLDQFREDMRQAGKARAARILVGRAALIRVLEECTIDEVIFADVMEVMPQIEEIMLVCAEKGIRTTVVADIFSMGVVKSGLSYFGDLPLIHYQTPPGDGWELGMKRVFDVALAVVLMGLLSPVFLLVALAIKCSSPGPVLFVQRRMGLNGRLFHMYKFRSMYQDAQRQLNSLREKNEMRGPVFKMKDDPRVTPVGRVLRRFSLDELPQLWNVFIGDMSLVGPRPPLPGEVSLYDRRNRRRLSMRPGITCTWQVSGRNEIPDFDDWVRMDLEYIDHWSLSRDLALLLKTIPAVICGTGAR